MSKGKRTDADKKRDLLKDGVTLSANYTHFNKTKEIIRWFKEGLTDKEIYYKILQENPKIKESSAMTYFKSAKASFKEEYILDRKFNIVQHVRRYDKDILKLSRHEPKTSSYYKYQKEKADAYLDMINLMQKKERVLGFHRKTTQIKIKNNVTVNLSTKKTFDFSNLTWEEKLALYRFVNKTFVDKNEKLELKPNIKKLNRIKGVEVEEVEEVSDDSIVNIDLIEEKEEILPDLDISGDPIVVKDKNIIDTVNQDIESNNLESIKQKLLNNLLKK